MDKYLLEILKEVNTIIIPNLGALSITNKETGEIMFMPYLKHDDGQLVAHIVEKEGMDENEAKNLIAKYVREILAELDKGEEYTMYKFGAFFKDGEDINFKNWNEIKSSTENIYIPPTKEEKPKKEDNQNTPNKEKIIKPIIEEKSPVSKEIPIDKKEELESNSKKLEKLKKEVNQEPRRKKKGVGFWVGIVLLLLLISGGTYFGLNYETLKDKIPFLAEEKKTYNIEEIVQQNKEELSEAEEIKIEESIEEIEDNAEKVLNEEMSLAQNDMVIAEENNSEENSTESQPETKDEEVETLSTSSSGQFNIITGAFSSLENAERLVKQLNSEGYSASIKSGVKLHKVSIQSFATSDEAKQALKQIKEKYPHAWIDKW